MKRFDSATRVLLVEDTPSLALVYESYLRKAGLDVVRTERLDETRLLLTQEQFPVILLDLQLPDGDGIGILEDLARTPRDTAVVVVTANGSINKAVEAMRHGAHDFIVKPFAEERLLTTVQNALENVDLKKSLDQVRGSLNRDRYHGFIGSSLAMQAVYRTIESVSQSNATVFITGESGTGKEVCAEAIHAASARRDKAFIPINCGAIPKELMESEVFGHLKGSFTGAIGDKQGAAAAAHGGTLFLDEICEMDLSLQTKLLRFLQSSTIQPVGSAKPLSVDVRIICATNRDPMEEVHAGRFREDLFYRLHVIPLQLPALDERGDDILEIATTFLEQFSQSDNKSFESFSAEAQRALLAYQWPGNVRELQNVIRQIVVLNDGPTITCDMIPGHLLQPATQVLPTVSGPSAFVRPSLDGSEPADSSLGAPMSSLTELIGRPFADIERHIFEATIAHCDGSIPKAAKVLKVSPSTIYRKREGWTETA